MAKIGLDYGHGSNTFPPSKGVYKDGKGYAEHTFNAKLGLKIKSLLEQHGHTVIEGQPANGREVGLSARTNLYNREKVDIVISVHANANSNEDVDGRCVFYWHTSTKGKQLAQTIVDEIEQAGYSTHGNGLHASERGSWTNLHITRETNMPAVLVEYGFMSNDEPGINDDFELIFGSKQDEYTDDMAQATVKAIQRYFGESFEKSVPAKDTKVKSNAKTSAKSSTYTGNSIVEYLDSIKEDSSYANRKKLARKHGISNYKGTEAQNLRLLSILRGGKAKASPSKSSQAKPKASRNSLPNAVYRVQSPYVRGSGVRAVQEALASVYYYPDKSARNNGIDGIYGPKTADAVRRFQSMHGLTADGIYGPATRRKLNQVGRNK